MSASTSLRRAVHPIASDAISLLLTHGITLTALVPLGAAVKGCDLRNKPSEEVLQTLQSVMATRGFLVFKEQGVLSGDEQVRAFVSCYMPAYAAYTPDLYAAAEGGGVDGKPTLKIAVDRSRAPCA